MESPEALASEASDSQLIAPLRVDDCLAMVVHHAESNRLEVIIGICVRKFDRAKGSKRREEGYQKRLRLMRPHSIIVVLLPSQLAQSFFPQIDKYLSEHHQQPVLWKSDGTSHTDTW